MTQLQIFTFRIGSKEVTAAEREQMTSMKKKLSVSISEEKRFIIYQIEKLNKAYKLKADNY
jgi:hypothetical protein